MQLTSTLLKQSLYLPPDHLVQMYRSDRLLKLLSIITYTDVCVRRSYSDRITIHTALGIRTFTSSSGSCPQSLFTLLHRRAFWISITFTLLKITLRVTEVKSVAFKLTKVLFICFNFLCIVSLSATFHVTIQASCNVFLLQHKLVHLIPHSKHKWKCYPALLIRHQAGWHHKQGWTVYRP